MSSFRGGGAEGDDRGDLVGLGVAAQRHGTEDLLAALVGQRAGHVGVDETGGDDVGRDAAAAELASDGTGEADQPGLRRRVVHLARRAGQPDDRRDEDHPAGLGLEHAPRGALGDAVGGRQVRVDDPGERLLAHPHEQPVVGDPGVGHQDLDRAVRGLGLGEGGVDRVGVGDVAVHREQAVGHPVLAGAVGHRHLVALGGERLGDRQADAAVSSGHEHAASHGGRT
jgi:hypothetical protein